MIPQTKIVALIPAYNEKVHITTVVGKAREYLPVLVVDDGSKDETAKLAESAGARVIRQIPNQGKGAALSRGFQYAIDEGFEALVMLDADGQHDPSEIPAFLEKYRQTGVDLIIGERDFSKMPLIRQCSNTIGRFMLSWAMGARIPDNQSGYRLLSRRLINAMLESQEHGFEFEVEMIPACIKRGWKLEWVPIRTIYADEKSHIHPVHHVINYFRIVFKTWKIMHRPDTKGSSGE